MLWGLIMEPQRRYTQRVKKSFHISMAALDISNSSQEPTQVMCGFDGRNYLLCTLEKGKIIQCPLDLNFEKGDEISFATNGEAHVHLTGYMNEDIYEDDDEDEDDEVEEEEEVENKRKRNKKTNQSDSPPKKKSKTEMLLNEIDSQDDSDDSDDPDVNSDIFEENAEEESDVSDDDNDIGDEEEEEEETQLSDENDSSLSEEEEEEEKPAPKQNGVAKKDKKPVEIKVPEKKGSAKKNKNEKVQKEQKPSAASPQRKVVEGGVMIEEVKQGSGAIAKPGKIVQVYYEGKFKNNNKMFDSTTKGPGFKFRLGRQEVIKGWDVGVQGMKVGGKRRITCPPNMAYGQKGSPPAIPPNSTLVFTVELKNVS